jgi:hypothetical protein
MMHFNDSDHELISQLRESLQLDGLVVVPRPVLHLTDEDLSPKSSLTNSIRIF